ncbi:hypothetical protein TYRP_021989 [Tyrophagus putrescentiae]|nr:hypothetical protein TYRP_021989 [Tyrophagus putrescentiae]
MTTCPPTLILATFTTRLIYLCLLCLALLSYVFEFSDDQQLDIGSVAAAWYEHIAKEWVNYPGHRGDFGYVLLFLLILLFHLLGMVAAFFEHFILLCVVLPCYLILLIVDYVLLGHVWVKVGYWAGLASFLFAIFATVDGVAFAVCLHYRGPSNLAAVFVCHDDSSDEEGDAPASAHSKQPKKVSRMKQKIVSAVPKKTKGAKGKGKGISKTA